MVFVELAVAVWNAVSAVVAWGVHGVWLCAVATGLLIVTTTWWWPFGGSDTVLRAVRRDVYRQLFARPLDSGTSPATSLWGKAWGWVECTGLSLSDQRVRTARHSQTARARRRLQQLVRAARTRGFLAARAEADAADADAADADAAAAAEEIRAFGGAAPDDADEAEAARNSTLLRALTADQRQQLDAQCPEEPVPVIERVGSAEYIAHYARVDAEQARVDAEQARADAAAGRPPRPIATNDAYGGVGSAVGRGVVVFVGGLFVACAFAPLTLVLLPCVCVVAFYRQSLRRCNKLALACLVAVCVAQPDTYGWYVARLCAAAACVTFVRAIAWMADAAGPPPQR